MEAMDALDVAQLGLRILLAAACVVVGAVHFPYRGRKLVAETMVPSRLAGSDPARQTSRMTAIVTALGVVWVAAGVGLLAPWPGARVGAALILIALIATLALVAAHAELQARRVSDASVGLVLPALGVAALLGLVVAAVV